jgi:hypothetical protein
MSKSTCGAEDGVGKLLEMGQMGRDAKAWPTGNELAGRYVARSAWFKQITPK